MSCTPFSVTLAVLATDNKRQVSFSINKGCLDNDKPFYVLIFILRDRAQTTDEFQDRVKLQVTVGDSQNDKAQRLIDNGLLSTQLNYLKGPLTNVTKDLPQGTSSDAKAEQALSAIVNTRPVPPK